MGQVSPQRTPTVGAAAPRPGRSRRPRATIGGVGPERGEDPGEAEDPFEGLTLDESFVRAAPVTEPTAADRERAARQANLSRLLADEAAQRANLEHERRRWAPGEDEVDWDVDESRRRRRRPLRIVALLVLLAVVLVYVGADLLRARDQPEPADRSSGELTPTGGSASVDPSGAGVDGGDVASDPSIVVAEAPAKRPEGWPPLDPTVSDQPLGRPGAYPEGGGPHSFVVFQEDGVTPVGYDPCRPVRYRVRGAGPAAGAEVVREAVSMVAAATGLRFVDEGVTDEAPSGDRAAYQPERYGERWAPVLIAWSDESESPDLGEVIEGQQGADVAGYASSQPVGLSTTDLATGETEETGLVFVTGTVVLDQPDLAAILERADGYAQARAIVAHELAHLVGLGHVDDESQLMFPRTTPSRTLFGAGDLQGLSRLGSLACFPEI